MKANRSRTDWRMKKSTSTAKQSKQPPLSVCKTTERRNGECSLAATQHAHALKIVVLLLPKRCTILRRDFSVAILSANWLLLSPRYRSLNRRIHWLTHSWEEAKLNSRKGLQSREERSVRKMKGARAEHPSLTSKSTCCDNYRYHCNS